MITEALVEVTALAEKGGVPNRSFIDFINGSVLGSTFIRHKGQAIVDRDYAPTFNNKTLRRGRRRSASSTVCDVRPPRQGCRRAQQGPHCLVRRLRP
jgi:hypothetical protein